MVPVCSSPRPDGSANRAFARTAYLVLLVGGLVACSCSDRGGGKVTGSVHLDGQPLADAYVGFVPKDQTAAANFGVTDAEGNFEVKRDKAKRTLSPGGYAVVVRKFVQKDGKLPPPAERDMLVASGTLKNVLPDRYASPKTSPLTAEIKPGDNALPPFELKSGR
jgi:hypothetical protein